MTLSQDHKVKFTVGSTLGLSTLAKGDLINLCVLLPRWHPWSQAHSLQPTRNTASDSTLRSQDVRGGFSSKTQQAQNMGKLLQRRLWFFLQRTEITLFLCWYTSQGRDEQIQNKMSLSQTWHGKGLQDAIYIA